MTLRVEQVQSALQELVNQQGRTIAIESEVTTELFGSEIPLGRVRYMYRQVRLANADEVQTQLANNDGMGLDIQLKLLPRADNAFRSKYLDW